MNFSNELKCPLCKSNAKSLWPELKVCKCQSCQLLFRYPAATEEELAVLYRTSWGDPNNQTDETGATSQELAQVYISELAKSLGRTDFKGLRILDYGAGRGAMQKALLDAGADAYSVEPFGYEYLLQKGYKAFRSLAELPKDIFFDGVISVDVVEHLQIPWDDYKNLKDHLTVNGWLYISTPNAAGINAQFYRAKWRELYNRGHLFFFTPATLKLALEESGYNHIKRLQWYINYRRGPVTTILHWLFEFMKIDGELRYLACK